MRELGLARLSEDKAGLIALDSATGEEFRIRADHRTKSLVDSLSPTTLSPTTLPPTTRQSTGQLESKMNSSLSPRDIQTRIRRGESPETIAEAAGVEVDRIMPYAVPVLAEREYMCEQARKTVLRRKHTGGSGVLLGALVDDQLLARGGAPEAAVWNAWKREDGRWNLAILPEGANETANFLFDVPGRYVVPADQLAHDLVGDVALPDSADMAIADAVRSPLNDEPAVTHANTEQHPHGVSSLKAARDRRAMGQLALGEEATDEPGTSGESGANSPAETGERIETVESTFVDEYTTYDINEIDQNVAVPDTIASHPAQQPSKKRHERRRVPSWDEIMFGGKPEPE